MTGSEKLVPPKGPPTGDPGAHELADISDSEDQFTDAQSAPPSPKPPSPTPPITRVEKVDDTPAHGEVPGTDAHDMRAADAEPDQIAVDADTSSPRDDRPSSSIPVPTTLVEESPGDAPGPHSEEYQERHKPDASPDLVVDPESHIKTIQGKSTTDEPPSSPPADEPTNPVPENTASTPPQASTPLKGEGEEGGGEEEGEEEGSEEAEGEEDGGDDFGDDFDDFEEGAGDDDFDDFEDGFQEADTSAEPTQTALPSQSSVLPFPIPDFDGLDADTILSTVEPYLPSLFPPEELDIPPLPPLSKESAVFLTPRSASLWSQLVAPPPLAPPDWIRSRTRRLFLVSLGVPVDLDEILPASKQKKLILPSLSLSATSPRVSSESRSVSRLRQGDGNASSTSVDSQGKKKRKGPPPQPELDLVAGRHLCMTTDEALDGMTDEELKSHVEKLKATEEAAKEALEYWTKRTDEKIGDREAFEGVIENLVKHARKTRK